MYFIVDYVKRKDANFYFVNVSQCESTHAIHDLKLQFYLWKFLIQDFNSQRSKYKYKFQDNNFVKIAYLLIYPSGNVNFYKRSIISH